MRSLADHAAGDVLDVVELAGLLPLRHLELLAEQPANDDLEDDAVGGLGRTLRLERADDHDRPPLAPTEDATELLGRVLRVR